MVLKALILAGGRGRRLAPLTNHIPKEMVEIKGRPVIEHIVKALKVSGIREIQVVIAPGKASIVDQLGSGDRLCVELSYRIQEEPLGTADAVARCRSFTGEDAFLVAYGDTYSNSETILRELVEAFVERAPDIMVLTQKVEDPSGFGLVMLGEKNEILDVSEKPDPVEAERYKTRDGFYVIRGFLVFQANMMKYILKTQPGINKERWLTDSVKIALKEGKRGEAFISSSKIFDIGTNRDLLEAQRSGTLNEHKFSM